MPTNENAWYLSLSWSEQKRIFQDMLARVDPKAKQMTRKELQKMWENATCRKPKRITK